MNVGWITLLVLGLAGCQRFKAKEILREFAGPEYFRKCEGADLSIELRYLPRTLQLISGNRVEDSSSISNIILDSLESETPISGGLAFLMTIAPRGATGENGSGRDLVHGGLGGYQDYRETLNAYSFGLKERIWLELDGQKWPLMSYHMENSFGMTPGRNFILVFAALPKLPGMGTVGADLVLDDIVPGLTRKKLHWTFPVGTHDQSI